MPIHRGQRASSAFRLYLIKQRTGAHGVTHTASPKRYSKFSDFFDLLSQRVLNAPPSLLAFHN
ncbi:MAG: hypothetical protein PUK59_01150 [Actinomycetaceae bacterium]|nr:hypothetical protein [Actinomycetaceae bacterium]MDY5853995.1 hypothetical protein [Arcanobacterium sp.]